MYKNWFHGKIKNFSIFVKSILAKLRVQKMAKCTFFKLWNEPKLTFWKIFECIKMYQNVYETKGVFTCLILASIVTVPIKYCDNAYKYWANSWKMCSSASVILVIIDTILLSFQAILINFKAYIWLTSNVDIYRKLLQSLQVLWQYLPVLHLQVNTFFKYWLNTCKYYLNTYKYWHNTCEYWAGE